MIKNRQKLSEWFLKEGVLFTYTVLDQNSIQFSGLVLDDSMTVAQALLKENKEEFTHLFSKGSDHSYAEDEISIWKNDKINFNMFDKMGTYIFAKKYLHLNDCFKGLDA